MILVLLLSACGKSEDEEEAEANAALNGVSAGDIRGEPDLTPSIRDLRDTLASCKTELQEAKPLLKMLLKGLRGKAASSRGAFNESSRGAQCAEEVADRLNDLKDKGLLKGGKLKNLLARVVKFLLKDRDR